MNSFTLFKHSFFGFSELRKAKNISFWKVIFYVIFLSIILAIPIAKQFFSVVYDVKQDGQKIAAKLPEFEIKNGQFKTKETDKGFIYQTNSIIFTFDPDGKRSLNDLLSDATGSAVAIGFLQDELVIALPNSSTVDALFGTSQFEIPYAEGTLNGVDSQALKTGLDDAKLPFWIYLISFIFVVYSTFINLIITLFLISVGASLYCRLRSIKIRFFDCLKISTYCMTLPVFLSSLLQLINPSIDTSFLLIFVSLAIFFFAFRDENRPN